MAGFQHPPSRSIAMVMMSNRRRSFHHQGRSEMAAMLNPFRLDDCSKRKWRPNNKQQGKAAVW